MSIEAGRPHLSFACILDREVWQAETAGFRGEVGELNCAVAVQHDFRLAVNTNVEQTLNEICARVGTLCTSLFTTRAEIYKIA